MVKSGRPLNDHKRFDFKLPNYGDDSSPTAATGSDLIKNLNDGAREEKTQNKKAHW